jgi:uncharacterized protein (TIGR02466 family)
MSDVHARIVELRERLRAVPGDRIAWHNLAAAEGDAGRPAEAEAAARRAIALGLPAPETRLVLARALQALRHLDDAERTFAEVLERRPLYVDAHRDYAQLVWMRTGDRSLALARLDDQLAQHRANAELHFTRSLVLEAMGDPTAAHEAATRALGLAPRDADILAHAAHLASIVDTPERAVALAEQAAESGGDARSRIVLAETLIGAGRTAEATRHVSALLASAPLDQYVIALQATLWRMAGDPRYGELYDYARLVGTVELVPPERYGSLEAFLAAVARELDALHGFVSHPFHQSVRAGSQLTFHNDDLARPIVRELFDSIREGVERHLRRLGQAADPFRARNTGRPNFTGAWSIRLREGGSHVDHVHPHGWLSSACYIAVPSTLGRGDGSSPSQHAGWLRLGQPGLRTPSPLRAERFVQPIPGRMVLFPAYMWHGVEPFTGDEPRLTVAFDVIPG